MSSALQAQTNREHIYALLLPGKHITPNHHWLACMIASWCEGKGVLPDFLGLEAPQFVNLKNAFFPLADLPLHAPSGSQLDFSRMLEKEDLVNLLFSFANPKVAEIDWIIAIVVAGCLGSDHLWQDLGLWNRQQLTDMLRHNFPDLAAKNDKDMKWKKFLYKQLCEAEGIYVCRAPSCDVCIDYAKCYGPEE